MGRDALRYFSSIAGKGFPRISNQRSTQIWDGTVSIRCLTLWSLMWRQDSSHSYTEILHLSMTVSHPNYALYTKPFIHQKIFLKIKRIFCVTWMRKVTYSIQWEAYYYRSRRWYDLLCLPYSDYRIRTWWSRRICHHSAKQRWEARRSQAYTARESKSRRASHGSTRSSWEDHLPDHGKPRWWTRTSC